MNKKIQMLIVVMIVILLSVSLPVFFVNFSDDIETGASWYDSNWKYCKQITIDKTKVSGNLTNFPVLVKTSAAEYAFAQADGDDFIFMDATNTTQYNHEIESFDGTNLVAWVNITYLTNTSDTIIYMYYGNPSATNQQNKNGTWGDVNNVVFHMGGNTGTLYDSTKNNHNGTETSDESSSGKIGNCQNIVRANSDTILLGDNDDFTYAAGSQDSAFSFSCWAKLDYTVTSSSQYYMMYTKGIYASGTLEYQLYYHTRTTGFGNCLVIVLYDASGNKQKQRGYTVTLSDNTNWNHIVFTYDGSETVGGLKAYVDGVLLTTVAVTTDDATYDAMENLNGSASIGAEPGGTSVFDGLMDEVHITRGTALNASWIATEYNNQNSTSTFMYFGLQQRYDATTWYDSGWKNCKKIVIDHTKVSGDQTNFPVLISNISTDFSIAQSSGNDFIFLNATNQTKYNHEIESFDRSTGTLVAWVNITNLSSSVDTIIYMYYGNAASGNQQNVYGTWSADYKVVQHLNDATTSTTADSTSNKYNGTKKAANEPIVTTSGKINYGQDFDGSNDFISCDDVCNFERTDKFTLSAWVKIADASPAIESSVISKFYAYGGYTLYILGNDLYFCLMDAAGSTRTITYTTANPLPLDNEWYYVTVTYAGTSLASGVHYYVNGNNVAFTTGTNNLAASIIYNNPLLFGAQGNSGGSRRYYFDGIIDEARVISGERTSTWLLTEYNNQNSTSTFESFGPQQGSPYGVAWYDSGWSYCKKITIDHTKVAENLTNFPVLFSNISADFKRAQADGDDFVFVDAINTTKYNHEIETFNSSTGELIVWINVTSLSSTTDTIIWMYYGNPTCSNQQNKIGTWDSNYHAVYHMKDNTTSTVADSTSNNYAGNKEGVSEPIEANGFLGKAQDFTQASGDETYVTTGITSTSALDSFTFSWWMKTSTKSRWVASKRGQFDSNSDTEWEAYIAADGTISHTVFVSSGSQPCQSTTNVADGNWYYYTGTYDGSTKKSVTYINGSSELNVTGSYAKRTGSQPVMMGAGPYTAYNYQYVGILDEFRVSKVARSSSWIITEYNNQNSTSKFMTLGDEITNWYNTSFLYRIKITIDHNKVSADLTNFPVLVKRTMNASRVQSDGDDLLFTSSGGTKLNHEIEAYNSTSGELVSWVNVTYVAGGSTTPDTYIYLYYGNSTCSSQQNANGTWDSNYKLVLHGKDNTSTTVLDSKSGRTVTKLASGKPAESTSGKIAIAQDYEMDTADYLTSVDSDDFSFGTGTTDTAFTIGMWIKFEGGEGAYNALMSKYKYDTGTLKEWYLYDYHYTDSGSWGYNFYLFDQSAGSSIMARGYTTSACYATGVWHFVVFRYSGNSSKNGLYVFYNGTDATYARATSGTYTAMENLAQPLEIGKFTGGSGLPLDGMLDEVRISKGIARSADWIATEYKNQNDPATFTIYSAEEQYVGAGGNTAPNTPTGLWPTTRQVAPSVTIYATATDPESDAITMYFYDNATKTEINGGSGHQSGASGSNISISWTGLSQGTSYSFYTAAFDGQAWSANSSVCTFSTNAPPVITGLMTENQSDPNRIINFIPYFNWTYTDNNTDAQIAYQIQVGTTQNGSQLWESGNVTSGNAFAIYNGSALSRSTPYFVRVRTYDGYEWSQW